MTRPLFLLLALLATPALACTSVDGLPDSSCTPGGVDLAVTQENIHQTICVPGYSKSVRPPVAVTNPMKWQVMQEYGLDGQNMRLYEGHHLVSIELGGCPGPDRGCDFHANFWPEPWSGPNGAHEKDLIENALHRLVCSGRMTLIEAQHRITSDWKTALDGVEQDQP
jgi:hypothetical protein